MDSAARPDEEEARRRRSTDCIYFLASPLTCKKGGECEYRHSDAARMNPRDCWYWFNGNCANPKCSFRHPPLDNLTGVPTTPRPAQQSVPQAQVSVPSQAHGAIPAKQKQGVPCYYFQKGMCTKGDRCAFLHVPQSAGNPALQPAKVFNPVLHPNPPLNNSNSWTKPNTSSQQNTPAVGIVDKPNSSAHDGKPVQQKEKLTSSADRPSRIYQNHSNSYAQTGLPKRYQPQPSVQGDLTDNGMEAGEFVSEPSAGSGVIVGGADDDVKQSFKGNHSTYHHRANGTAMLRQTHGGYEPERSYKSSAERSSSEKRISQRERIPAVAASSLDLRNRLLKQRKLNNNSRSTEAPVQNGTHPEDEHSDQHKRGEHQDGLSRSRLRDRIRLPGETSFDRLGSHSEEWDRGSRTRLSPPKPSDLRRRLHERLKARSAEEIPGNSAKGLVVKASSSEDAESLNFAGPKSLAELKAKKGVGMSGEDAIVRSLGSSRMTSEIVSSREAAPFEGPKPLSAILKRKREAAFANPAAQSGIIQEADNDAVAVEEEFQPIANDTVWENMEGTGEEEEEEAFHPENDVAYEDNNDEAAGAQELEEHQDPEAAAEDYDDEAAAAQEQEEHQDAEVAAEDYDYEAADINDEEENDYQEYHDNDDNEDLDDNDDDFARKVSVMIS